MTEENQNEQQEAPDLEKKVAALEQELLETQANLGKTLPVVRNYDRKVETRRQIIDLVNSKQLPYDDIMDVMDSVKSLALEAKITEKIKQQLNQEDQNV